MFKRFSLKSKKIAVALKYSPETMDDTPQVIAKGFDIRADAITNLAKKHNVPVYSDPELAQLLASTELGDLIPPTAFLAVAKILKLIYEKSPRKKPEILNNTSPVLLGKATPTIYNSR